MDRGYYKMSEFEVENTNWVAIHNKNGKGLLLTVRTVPTDWLCESQSTIKMDKGYYINATIYPFMPIACRNPQ